MWRSESKGTIKGQTRKHHMNDVNVLKVVTPAQRRGAWALNISTHRLPRMRIAYGLGGIGVRGAAERGRQSVRRFRRVMRATRLLTYGPHFLIGA